MTELICECGQRASGPDAESVTAAMDRHLEASGHSLASAPAEAAPEESQGTLEAEDLPSEPEVDENGIPTEGE